MLPETSSSTSSNLESTLSLFTLSRIAHSFRPQVNLRTGRCIGVRFGGDGELVTTRVAGWRSARPPAAACQLAIALFSTAASWETM